MICNFLVDVFERSLVGADKTTEIERQSVVLFCDTAAGRPILKVLSKKKVQVVIIQLKIII